MKTFTFFAREPERHLRMYDRRHSALLYASIVSLGGFLFGFDAAVISGMVGFIGPEFGLDEWQVGLVVGAPTLGGIIAEL